MHRMGNTEAVFLTPTARFVRWVKSCVGGFFSFLGACVAGVIIAMPILLWLGFWIAVICVALHFISKWW